MTDVYEDGLNRDQAWSRFFRNHPNILASWGHQNGRWPNCGCATCDPRGIQPPADILATEPGKESPR